MITAAAFAFTLGCIAGAAGMAWYTRWRTARALEILTAAVDTHVTLLEAETAAQSRREEEKQSWQTLPN